MTNDLYIPFINVTLTVNWIVYLIFAAFRHRGLRQLREPHRWYRRSGSSVTAVVMAFFMGTAMIWKFTTLGIFSSALCGSLLGFYACITAIPPSASWVTPAACF